MISTCKRQLKHPFDGQNTQHSYRNTFEKCNALNTWWTSNESLLMECIATGTLGGVQANLWVLPSENIVMMNKLNQCKVIKPRSVSYLTQDL